MRMRMGVSYDVDSVKNGEEPQFAWGLTGVWPSLQGNVRVGVEEVLDLSLAELFPCLERFGKDRV